MLYDAHMQTPLNSANTLNHLLFESPGWIILGLAVVWTVMRLVGRRSGNVKLMRASWLPLGLIVSLLACASLVTTPREALAKTMTQLLLAVEYNDMPAFREMVLPEAMTSVFDREMSRDELEKLIGKAKINDLKVTSSSIHIEGDSAMCMVIIRADGSVANAPGIQLTRWAIRWRLEDDQWRAQRLECLAIGADAVFNRD